VIFILLGKVECFRLCYHDLIVIETLTELCTEDRVKLMFELMLNISQPKIVFVMKLK